MTTERTNGVASLIAEIFAFFEIFTEEINFEITLLIIIIPK